MDFLNRMYLAKSNVSYYKKRWIKNIALTIFSLLIFTVIFTLTTSFQKAYEANSNNMILCRTISVSVPMAREQYYDTYFAELLSRSATGRQD